MKTSLRFFLFSLTMALAAAALGAGLPTLDVMVSDAGGKVAYKGKTAANGTFATAALSPGEYTVQFKTGGAVGGAYELVLSAGKQKVVSGTVDGSKFAKGGVAMRVKVGPGTNIAGQLTSGKGGTLAVSGPGGAKVKIVNGKRFVWQGPETGSNIAGRWVEEGTPSNVLRGGRESLGDKGGQGSAKGR